MQRLGCAPSRDKDYVRSNLLLGLQIYSWGCKFAGYAQYTISFEVFTPLLLSYITRLLEILSLLAISKTEEKHHKEIIVYSINVAFNEDSIGTV
jgi:hypothetical protein